MLEIPFLKELLLMAIENSYLCRH